MTRDHYTAQNDGGCWCAPVIEDQLDGSRIIFHRPPAIHVLPTSEEGE